MRDVLGAWFEAIASHGHDIDIHFAKLASQDAAPEWLPLPHSRVDGVGGFAQCLRENGHVGLRDLPELTEHLSANPLRVIVCWLHYLRPRFRYRWPSLGTPVAPTDVAGRIAIRVFDEAETKQIVGRSKSLQVTVNTLLLDRISRVVRRHLVGSPRDVWWMIPVNIRGPLRLPSETANHSTFIEVAARSDEAETVLQERVRGTLARHQHWAFWYSFQFGRLFGKIGRRLFMWFALRSKPQWVGSFSNLGRWSPPADGPTPYAWVFCPPPVPSQPLGVGCVTYQGRLGITLLLHHSLTPDPSVARAWLSEIASELLAEPPLKSATSSA